MKKIYVNKEACIGCGACVAIDGEHFDFDDSGLSDVISNENIDTDSVKNAMASCPTNAISYAEEGDEVSNLDNDEHDCSCCEGKECCHKKETD